MPFRRSRRRCARIGFLVIFLLILLTWQLMWTNDDFNDNQSLVIKDANFAVLSPAEIPKKSNEKLFLLVIISSSPLPLGPSVERRKAIRETWGKFDTSKFAEYKDRKWRTVFMMGLTGNSEDDAKIYEENRNHGDLLICGYRDNYREITSKLLTAFRWAATEKYNFVLKTDEDVYISIPRLLHWLEHKSKDTGPLYAGKLYSASVVRDKNHRHYVSPASLPYKYYPSFCKGSMYVLSWTLVPQMVEMSRKVRRIPPDDAYVGLLAHELHVIPTPLHGIVQQSLLPYFFPFLGPCHFQTMIGIGDSLTANQIFYLHSQMSSLPVPSSWLCISRWLKAIIIGIILFIGFLFVKRCARVRKAY